MTETLFTEAAEVESVDAPVEETPDTPDPMQFAKLLRNRVMGVRFRKSKMGTTKAYTDEQNAKQAEVFDASEKSCRGSKRLFGDEGTKIPEWTAVTNIIANAGAFFRTMTAPHPEDTVRLIDRETVDAFDTEMKKRRKELDVALMALEEVYPQMIQAAKEDLRELWDAADYKASVFGEFNFEWTFRDMNPPESLKQISPELYDQQVAMVEKTFARAVELQTQELAEQFGNLVAHLAERLQPKEDGKQNTLNATTVENFDAFFGVFEKLNDGSRGHLSELVEKARKVLNGVEVKDLKKDLQRRTSLADEMVKLSQGVDAMLEKKPKRKFKV